MNTHCIQTREFTDANKLEALKYILQCLAELHMKHLKGNHFTNNPGDQHILSTYCVTYSLCCLFLVERAYAPPMDVYIYVHVYVYVCVHTRIYAYIHIFLFKKTLS